VYFGQQTGLTLPLSTTSDDQNRAIPVKEILREHGKRSFEWSSNWTVKKTSSRTARLMLVDTGVVTFVVFIIFMKYCNAKI